MIMSNEIAINIDSDNTYPYNKCKLIVAHSNLFPISSTTINEILINIGTRGNYPLLIECKLYHSVPIEYVKLKI